MTAALEYHRRGFSVIPVDATAKKPCVEWREYEEKRPSKSQLRSWWEKHPKAGIGIVTGMASNLAVVDLDGEEAREAFLQHHLSLPLTPCATTPRGGCHLWYQHPGEPVKTCAGIYPSVDIRGDGGFVVAAPSRSRIGAYDWIDTLSLDDIDLAPLPEWVPLKDVTRNHWKSDTEGEGFHMPATENSHRLNIKSMGILVIPDRCLSRVALLLGIPESGVSNLGSPFPCILPGHEEEKPSASLYRMDDGTIMYRDWHSRDGKEWYGLPEVYAARCYGRIEKLTTTVFKVWETRLFAELGLIILPPVTLPPLSPSATKATHAVYNGLKFLFQCKWVQFPGSPTTFTGPFGAAWCRLDAKTVATAMGQFLKQGILRKGEPVTRHGRHEVWTFFPGNLPPMTHYNLIEA